MSCLFDSIGYFVSLPGIDVRRYICDYLEANHPIIDGLETKVILEMEDKEYITKMRHPEVWGGSNEIQASCNLWKLHIIVSNSRDKTIIEFLPLLVKPEKVIYLIWNGRHYEAAELKTKP